MEALQPSFMLLPDFAFPADRDICLGSILPMVRDTKRPNPRCPLTAAIIVVAEDVSVQTYAPWSWNSESSVSQSGGVFADLSFISGIGAGVDGGHSHVSRMAIECDRVIRKTFRPTKAAIARVASDQTITAILKKLTRPSVYIVTGIMIAHRARIELTKAQGLSGGAHTSMDVTQIGVPINAGIKGEASKMETTTPSQTPKEDFLLAYQLLRVKKKLGQRLNASEENRWALFNDDQEYEGSDDLTEEKEIVQVVEGFQWSDDDDK